MTRTYVSRLRADQAEATRVRVVEAVAAVLARDISAFTIPAVAAEAGVSAATVERLFPTKRDLLEALAKHYSKQIGSAPSWKGPVTVDAMLEELPGIMKRTSAIPPVLRAAVASELFQQFRRDERGHRLESVEAMLKPYRAKFSARELRHLRNTIAVLGSSAGLQAFTDLTGSSADEASETMAWVIRRLLGMADPKAGLVRARNSAG